MSIFALGYVVIAELFKGLLYKPFDVRSPNL